MRLAAAAAALKRASGISSAPFSLAFLTDRRRVAQPEPILSALPAGAAVIYRDYDDPRRAWIARRYAAICRRRGVLFLVARDEALARAIGADGIHWPARFFGNREPGTGNRLMSADPVPGSRFPAPEGRFLVTAACHNAEELSLAHALGADLALLSPVFLTQSHPDTEHLGAARFREIAAASPIPVLALGGVDEKNAQLVAGPKVAGLAAIGAFAGQG